MKETAIQAIDTSALRIVSPDQAFLEVVDANMEGCTARFDRIKIPSGGGLAFEFADENGETSVATEIAGVIVGHFRVNAYWAKKLGQGGGGNNPPDCASVDGETGICANESLSLGGSCARCPMNQWGSARDNEGKPTRGKACKNIHRVYIVRPGDYYPVVVALPPTSLKNFDMFMQRLTSKGRPFFSVLSKVRLNKVTSKSAGTDYSEALFSKVGDLTPEEAMAVKAYIVKIRDTMRGQAIEADDYNTVSVEGETKAPETQPF